MVIEQHGDEPDAVLDRGRELLAAEQKAAVDKVSEKLRKRLSGNLKGKKEAAKSDFPPYKTALSKGFKHGTEPSSSECEMTYSERSEIQMQLQLGSLLYGR